MVDGLRALLDCNGRVLPVSVEHATLCAEYEDGSRATTEVGVDQEQAEGRRIARISLDPEPNVHQAVSEAIRSFDVVIANDAEPAAEVLARYAVEQKDILPVGDIPDGCQLVTGHFWQGQIARHARRRLAYAVWSVLAQRLLH